MNKKITEEVTTKTTYALNKNISAEQTVITKNGNHVDTTTVFLSKVSKNYKPFYYYPYALEALEIVSKGLKRKKPFKVSEHGVTEVVNPFKPIHNIDFETFTEKDFKYIMKFSEDRTSFLAYNICSPEQLAALKIDLSYIGNFNTRNCNINKVAWALNHSNMVSNLKIEDIPSYYGGGQGLSYTIRVPQDVLNTVYKKHRYKDETLYSILKEFMYDGAANGDDIFEVNKYLIKEQLN